MLDMESTNAAKTLLLRAGTIATAAFVFGAVHHLPLAAPLTLLTTTCILAACVSATLALCSRDALCGGRLNHWDGAIAFLALSRLTHLCLDMQGG